MASPEQFEDWKKDIEHRAQESVKNSSSESVMNELSKIPEEQQPFIEHRGGKIFAEGKEGEPFSDIDAWGNMNLDKNPEELADGFIKQEEEEYKKLGHESGFYI